MDRHKLRLINKKRKDMRKNLRYLLKIYVTRRVSLVKDTMGFERISLQMPTNGDRKQEKT